MRNLFKFCYLMNIILAAASLFILPEQTATHFNLRGLPDTWGPPWVCAMIVVVISTLVFVMTLFVPYMIKHIPSQYINMPNKGYWLSVENRPKAVAKLKSYMSEFGASILILILCINIITINGNLFTPKRLDTKLFFTYLAIFMLYTVYWCIKLCTGFKIPKSPAKAGTRYRATRY